MTIDRRTLLAGSVAALAAPALKIEAPAAVAMPAPRYPILPPLEPNPPEWIAKATAKLEELWPATQWEEEALSTVAQRMSAVRAIGLAFPQPNAVELMMEGAAKYPRAADKFHHAINERLKGHSHWLGPHFDIVPEGKPSP